MKLLQMSVATMCASILVTSYNVQHNVYHNMYLLLLIFGILNHGLERSNNNINKNIIHIIDIILAHFTFLYTVYESFQYTFMNISLFNIFVLFVLEHKYPKYDIVLHLFIHLHTAISMNIYLQLTHFQHMTSKIV